MAAEGEAIGRRTMLAMLGAVACGPVYDSRRSIPPPRTRVRRAAESLEPTVAVALASGVAAIAVGSRSALRVASDGGVIGTIPVAAQALVSIRDGVPIIGALTAPAGVFHLSTVDGGTLRVRDREYRGHVEIRASSAGLLVVNRLGIEEYVAGVVSAEMGHRAPGEEAALEAQAIAARTYALRALARHRDRPFDLFATRDDQVYGGESAETPAGRAAVSGTRGVVLTHDGRPIEAFFHSTCGGRTATGAEVFVNGELPYLPSIVDRNADGSSFCAMSPRFRWREEWSARELAATLRTSLPRAIRDIVDIVVAERSTSGRVSRVNIRLDTDDVPIIGQAIRRAFRPHGAPRLRSAAFRVQTVRSGNRLRRLVLHGRGSGHGVGMCQWGSIGRARAGHTADEIVAAYFPGTTLERRW